MVQPCATAPTDTINICVPTTSVCEGMAGGTVVPCTDSFKCGDPAPPVCCAITPHLGIPDSSATYSASHCSEGGMTAKCTTLSGTVQFYYGGSTVDAQETCRKLGGTWLKS